MAIERHFREMTPRERELVNILLAAEFTGNRELSLQVGHRRVRRIDAEGSLEFQQDSQDNQAPVTMRIPVEAEASDVDGVGIHALLHVVNGQVTELEIYKDDGSPITRMPSAVEFEIFVPQPPR